MTVLFILTVDFHFQPKFVSVCTWPGTTLEAKLVGRQESLWVRSKYECYNSEKR